MSTITAFPSLYRREDSRALVANIRANPEDDTARLAYADWLDENADDDTAHRDHYEARAAFLRAGCCNPGKSLTRLNRAESRWLDGNWEQLFPTLMQLQCFHNNKKKELVPSPLQWRKGRIFRFELHYRFFNVISDFHPRDYAGYFTAHLRRGFIDRIDWHDNLPYWQRLAPAIAKDDPFVCMQFPETAGPAVQHADGTWVRRIQEADVGQEVLSLLRPTMMFKGQDGRPVRASYMDRDQLKTLDMAARDLNRASREWAEAAPITVSMTDAEFFGSGRRQASPAAV